MQFELGEMRKSAIAIALFGAGVSIFLLYRIVTNLGGVSDSLGWLVVALLVVLILSPYFRLYRKAEFFGNSAGGMFGIVGIVVLGLLVMFVAFGLGHAGGLFLIVGPALQHFVVWIATAPTKDPPHAT